MSGRGKQAAQSKYDHLIKLLLIGDSGKELCGGWPSLPHPKEDNLLLSWLSLL